MGMFETLGQRAAEAPLRKLMKTLEETRGLKFKKFVPWHVKDRQELGVFFARQMELYYPDHQSQLDQGMLLHLGLVKPGFSIRGFMQELFTEQIAGAYDPDTKEFFAVDVRQDLFTKMLVGEEAHLVLLFHELDHALGDQYYDLKKLQMEAVKAHNTDMAMARAAVFEGDATLVMFDFQMRGTGMNADDSATNMGDMVDWLVKFPIPLPGMGGYQKAPLYFKKSLIFPYYNGMDFVRELRRFGGWKTVNQAYSQLPNSTEQILHPEKYLLTFAADPPVPVHLKKLPREVNGWKASQHDDTGGEFLVRIFLEQHEVPKMERRATGWGGDRYRLYQKGKESFLIWKLVFDTPSDAVDFYQGVKTLSDYQVSYRAKTVVVGHGVPAKLWKAFRQRLE